MSEEYDEIVEGLYLAAVNDYSTVVLCQRVINDGDYMLRSCVSHALNATLQDSRRAGLKAPSVGQLRKAWDKIVYHLTDKTPEQLLKEASHSEFGDSYTLEDCNEKFNETLNFGVKIMSELSNTPYKAVEYVYGKDITTAGADELIEMIKRSKGEITSLDAAGVDSKYIKNKVKELNSAIDTMVKRLDTL